MDVGYTARSAVHLPSLGSLGNLPGRCIVISHRSVRVVSLPEVSAIWYVVVKSHYFLAIIIVYV
jgi:hypothetical protein